MSAAETLAEVGVQLQSSTLPTYSSRLSAAIGEQWEAARL